MKSPILSVTEFPWVKTPVNPKTKEEYAYKMGQYVAHLRSLLDDDSIEMIWNGGAGPGKNLFKPDVEQLNPGVSVETTVYPGLPQRCVANPFGRLPQVFVLVGAVDDLLKRVQRCLVKLQTRRPANATTGTKLQ